MFCNHSLNYKWSFFSDPPTPSPSDPPGPATTTPGCPPPDSPTQSSTTKPHLQNIYPHQRTPPPITSRLTKYNERKRNDFYSKLSISFQSQVDIPPVMRTLSTLSAVLVEIKPVSAINKLSFARMKTISIPSIEQVLPPPRHRPLLPRVPASPLPQDGFHLGLHQEVRNTCLPSQTLAMLHPTEEIKYYRRSSHLQLLFSLLHIQGFFQWQTIVILAIGKS